MTIKHQLAFDTLVSLLKKNHVVVLCGSGDEPSIEITLEQDDIPEDLTDAVFKIEQIWDDL